MKISVFYDHMMEAVRQRGISFEEVSKAAKDSGICAVEMENKRLMADEAGILEQLKKAGLAISCIYGHFDFSHKDDAAVGYETVDLAARAGVKTVMLVPGFYNKDEKFDSLDNPVNQRMAGVIAQVCAYAKEKGITVVLEDFDDVIASYCNAAGMLYFMDRVPDLYCAFDTGNFLYCEEDAKEVLPLFLEKVRHMHCKDRTWEKNEGDSKKTISGRDMYACPVGYGVIGMQEIIKKVLAQGYDGYFTIEHFGSIDQLDAMVKSAQWLKRFE